MEEVSNLDTSIDVKLLQPRNIEFTLVTGALFISPKVIDSNALHPPNKYVILVTDDQVKCEKSSDFIFTTLLSPFLLKNPPKDSGGVLKFILTSVPAGISKATFLA